MKISVNNSSAIETTLSKINGRAKMYTFADADDLTEVIQSVMKDHDATDGMTIVARSGRTMHGYDRTVLRNEVTLTCEGSGDDAEWYMTDCEKINGSWYVREHVVTFAS